ncbi:MAG: baseplate J/gp47 family protein [Gammaproteobacteria bacterium]
MPFQIKDFPSIVASMINRAKATQTKITDFRVGSVSRTLMESPAIEIEELYQQMFNGLLAAIPTALYQTFQFDLLPAAAASSTVTFSVATAPVTTPIVIPAGSVVRVPGGAIGYATGADATIAVGQTSVSALITADTEGTIGNTVANTITAMDSPISGVSVTNPGDITSGRDIESEDDRAQRFREYILSLSRGPLASVEFGAETATITDAFGIVTEYVDSALAVEPYLTNPLRYPGYIECYIYNGVSGASAGLVAEAQKIVDGYYDANGNRVIGWKSGGVICDVKAVEIVSVNIAATLTSESGYVLADLITAAEVEINNYVSQLGIGETLVLSEIVRRVRGVEGIYDVKILAPLANVTAEFSQKLSVLSLAVS